MQLSSYSHDHHNLFYRSAELKYRPHRGKTVKVKLVFTCDPATDPAAAERNYTIEADGQVPDAWLAKKVLFLDAWVLQVPAELHRLASCTRTENILRVVASKPEIPPEPEEEVVERTFGAPETLERLRGWFRARTQVPSA